MEQLCWNGDGKMTSLSFSPCYVDLRPFFSKMAGEMVLAEGQ